MRYIYAIIPVLLPITTAASLKKEFSTEDRLRDHMAMFRHVLHGDKEPQVSAETLKAPKFEPYSAPVFIQNVQATPKKQPDQSSKPEKPSSEENIVHADPGEKDTQTSPKSTNKTLPEGEFNILPISQPGDVLPLLSLSGSPDQPALPTPVSQTNIPGSQEGTVGDPKRDNDRTVPESIVDLKTLTSAEPAPSTKTSGPLPVDSSKEVAADDDEYAEDARLPSLLANGLKSLLSNESDFSAVFEFPDMHPKTVTLTVTTHTVPETSIATPTDHTPIQSDIPYDNKTAVLSETATSTAVTAMPTEFKVPVIDPEHDVPMTMIEGKANLKSVLDMVRDRRKPSSDVSRQKKGTKPRSYIEHTNSTKVIDAPRKVHSKDLLGRELPDSLAYNEPKLEDISEPESPVSRTKHKLRPSQQSVSDIRKIYFQSLERSADEDLISYFQRIYPELEHLLGKSLSDSDNTEANSLLARLSEDLQKAGLPSLSQSQTISSNDPVPSKTVTDNTLLASQAPKNEPFTAIASSSTSLASSSTSQAHQIKPPELKKTNETFSVANMTSEHAHAEHKNLMLRITDAIQGISKEKLFHNPFEFSVASEAANSAEIYPSIIGAVIFALFLILL
ncbi:hypothetical protein OY671_007333 [Metschnikowia pulcherrima]|nr:hypothetical protein OY671_007333 [Metschnikowia pulcherrima]